MIQLNNSISLRLVVATLSLVVTLFALPQGVSAHRSPETCSGSGLAINLYASATEAHVGDTITLSVEIFNGTSPTPISCDATAIEASITTPDGIVHPLTLTRTALSNTELDAYNSVVSYTIASADLQPDNSLTVTAAVAGDIHQNDSDSRGGGNQGLNITIIQPATLTVIKTVVNAHAGTAVSSDFTLHVLASGTDVSGSPAAGSATPGRTYTLAAGTYRVTEDANALYTSIISGDCATDGTITLLAGATKTCTVTNSDIAPPVVVPPPPVVTGGGGGSTVGSSGGGGYTPVIVLPRINVVKAAAPNFLPSGSGEVVYSYSVWNPEGQLALRNVTLVDDKCSSVIFQGGDTSNDNKLTHGENWSYTCTMQLYATTTNIALASGFGDNAAGLLVIASTSVTVGVGSPTLSSVPTPPVVIYPSLPDAGFIPRAFVDAGQSTLIALLISSAIVAAFISKRRWSRLGEIS